MEEFEEFIRLFESTVGAQQARAAVMVARAQPPTVGHYRVIDAMKKFIRENPDLKLAATPIVVIVEGKETSKDGTKNPLSADERIKFMTASGRANGVVFLKAATGFAAFEAVRRAGFEPIAVAAGSDRADTYVKLLNKYFSAKDGAPIKHVKIPGLGREGQDGGQDAKAGTMNAALAALQSGSELDVSEVSGSMARRAVELGYEPEFAQIVGLEKRPKLAKMMFDRMRRTIGGSDGAA